MSLGTPKALRRPLANFQKHPCISLGEIWFTSCYHKVVGGGGSPEWIVRLGGENPEIVRSGEISAAQPPRRSGAPCLAAQPPRRLLGDQNPFARHSEAICNGKLPGFSLPAAPNHTRLVGIWRLHHSIKDDLEKSIPHFVNNRTALYRLVKRKNMCLGAPPTKMQYTQ